MKKTISISIAKTHFHVEEDGYEVLRAYLESVKKRFGGTPEGDEIVSDIEGRVAELFSEKPGVVTLSDVEAAINTLGRVEDFDKEGTDSAAPKGRFGKRLYRNEDDAVIAGVASGIAAYFGTDPIVMRIIFGASILFGGTGIFLYLLLWIIVPAAKTPGQKLEMRGNSVTLDSLGRTVREKVETVNKEGTLRKAIAVPVELIKTAARFIREKAFPFVRTALGLALSAFSAVALVGLTFILIFLAASGDSAAIDFPLSHFYGSFAYAAAVISGFMAIAIPFLFIQSLSMMLMRRKGFGSNAALSLLGIWFVALMALGLSAFSLASHDRAAYGDRYAHVTERFDASGFSAIDVKDGQYVELSEGPAWSVEAEGRSRDVESIRTEVVDGALVVSRVREDRICIFCGGRDATVRVTMPALSALTVRNASYVEGQTAFHTKDLAITLENVSRADLEAMASTTSVTLKNSSSLELDGATDTLDANLQNASRMEARGFKAVSAEVNLENFSSAEVNVVGQLTVEADNASSLEYAGNAKVKSELRNGSRVEESQDRN